MIKRPRFRDIFTYRIPVEVQNQLFMDGKENEYKTVEENHILHWEKIKFDNAIRVWIAIPTYLACIGLWAAGLMASMVPMTVIFLGYGALQFVLTWIFLDSKHARRFDYILSAGDLFAMSFAIFQTGGASSPLYFLYFIPMIVHAFHRDWNLCLFNGIGGGVLYAVAALQSLESLRPAELTDLGVRLFFMVLTIGISFLALNMLRKWDAVYRLQVSRLHAMTAVGQTLNQLSSLREFPTMVPSLIKIINTGLGKQYDPWTRILITQDNSTLLRAYDDPAVHRPELKQEIAANACPVMQSNELFVLDNVNTGHECPTENFDFKSHICIPINGTENETFGVLFTGSSSTTAFKADEKQFLKFAGRSIGLAFQRLQRMEELRRANEMNSCVTAAFLASQRSVDATLHTILDGILTMLKVDHANIMLWDVTTGTLEIKKTLGERVNWGNLKLRLGEGMPGRVLDKGEPAWSGDLMSELPTDQARQSNVKSMLSLPLKSLKNEPLGVINACHVKSMDSFSQVDIQLCSTFAIRAAMSLENALRQDARKWGDQSKAA